MGIKLNIKMVYTPVHHLQTLKVCAQSYPTYVGIMMKLFVKER